MKLITGRTQTGMGNEEMWLLTGHNSDHEEPWIPF